MEKLVKRVLVLQSSILNKDESRLFTGLFYHSALLINNTLGGIVTEKLANFYT